MTYLLHIFLGWSINTCKLYSMVCYCSSWSSVNLTIPFLSFSSLKRTHGGPIDIVRPASFTIFGLRIIHCIQFHCLIRESYNPSTDLKPIRDGHNINFLYCCIGLNSSEFTFHFKFLHLFNRSCIILSYSIVESLKA